MKIINNFTCHSNRAVTGQRFGILSILIIFGLMIGLLFEGQSQAQSIAIIVNPAITDNTIKAKTVRKIYLGKSNQTDAGAAITAVDQDDSDLRVQFYLKVTRKNPDKLKLYWTKKVMSGKGSKLKRVGGDSKIVEWVAGHADAMGFVDASKVDDSVKVLLIIE
ncbi:MAG: phosphate ABC transporter substrate-binding protein [Algicola sp.]|nr:phosphate ABC transporter substrate-binding protein [Algicola sp.]